MQEDISLKNDGVQEQLSLFNEDCHDDYQQILELDQFDDSVQNKQAYDGEISGDKIFQNMFLNYFPINSEGGFIDGPIEVLDVGCGGGNKFLVNYLVLNEDSRYVGVDPNPKRLFNNEITGISFQKAVAESLPFKSYEFDVVVCWGTFCFVRSPFEALYEMHRVLEVTGYLIMDVVTETTLPISQTVNADCFVKYAELFGFELMQKVFFNDPKPHYRCGFVFRKIDGFDEKRFLMPQCVGTINNYLEERDWYLK